MKKFVEKIELLDNITQWSERDSVIKESVSQHSFKVAAIANYLLKQIESGIKIKVEMIESLSFSKKNYEQTPDWFYKFKAEALSYAIMHDFDEAIFGRDISHIVKYNKFNGEHIRKSIDEYVEHILETEFSGLLPKPTEVVKHFVKLCDWLALLTFVNRNQNMGAKTFSNEDVYCRDKIIETMKEVEELIFQSFRVKLRLYSYIKVDKI